MASKSGRDKRGIFHPTIDAQGNVSVSVRVDKCITAALNVPGVHLKMNS